MKLLLDTHIFLWFISGFQKEIRLQENDVSLSVVSLWEIIVKYQLGKLPLPQPPEIYIPQQREKDSPLLECWCPSSARFPL